MFDLCSLLTFWLVILDMGREVYGQSYMCLISVSLFTVRRRNCERRDQKMEEAMSARYWCHMCSRTVNPVMEVEIKCPLCQGGFIEEMGNSPRDHQETDPALGPDRALSLWAPVLLGLISNPGRPRRARRFGLGLGLEEDHNEGGLGEESELDREIDSIIHRRRRSSATILQLLRGVRAESESENNAEGGERVVLINPFNQTIIVQDSNPTNPPQSLGDYFIGPGLDILLQHLAENDPNRLGTPPAKKEAVEAMPTVKVDENLQCSVCLDDFVVGDDAKEMPCRHKFHPGCIHPWLELHSSCPVCRYQLPAEESKGEPDGPVRASGSGTESESGGDGNGRRFTFRWPFSGLFSSPADASGGSASRTDEN